MSMKAALKSVRNNLESDPGRAAVEAREILERDPENYNA